MPTRPRPRCARRTRRSASTRRPPACRSSAVLGEVFIPVSDFRITPDRRDRRRAPVLTPNPAEVARILTPPVDAFLPDAADRDRRADDRRLAAPLRRLPDRRASTSGARPPGSSASSAPCSRAPRPALRPVATSDGVAGLRVGASAPGPDRGALPSPGRPARSSARARALPSMSSRPMPVVRAGELDDDRPHVAMIGPCAVRHAGRPEDRLAGRDPGVLLVDDDPAAALDDDEPGRVRVGVGLDPAVPAERELTDRPRPSLWIASAGDCRSCRADRPGGGGRRRSGGVSIGIGGRCGSLAAAPRRPARAGGGSGRHVTARGGPFASPARPSAGS